METLNINLFGVPRCGVPACAYVICAELAKRGIESEYVPSAARECFRNGASYFLDGSYDNESILHMRQKDRVRRLQGRVEVAVTDFPALESVLYLGEGVGAKERGDFTAWAIDEFARQRNFNILVERQSEGPRCPFCNGQGDREGVGEQTKALLTAAGFFFGSYSCDKLGSICVENIVRTVDRIRSESLEPLPRG